MQTYSWLSLLITQNVNLLFGCREATAANVRLHSQANPNVTLQKFELAALTFSPPFLPYLSNCCHYQFSNSLKMIFFQLRNVKLEETFQDEAKAKEIEKASMKCSQAIYDKKTAPSLFLSREVGNMYTPSLYGCLASLLFRYDGQ